MPVAGVDIGGKTTKIIILEDHKILAKNLVLTGLETEKAALTAYQETLEKSRLSPERISKITVTGVGKKEFSLAHNEVSEVKADAKGTIFLLPLARTVIDVGAEEGRGVKCSPEGKVVDFALNEKCAAGSGSFVEAMSRALEIPLEEIGKLALTSTQQIPMNAQCAVFAESEVVSLLHAKTPKADIAKAVHNAIANRISSMTRKIGIEKEVVLIGGVAKNLGFIESLKKDLGLEILIPEEPEYVGALGAALIALEEN